MKFNEINKLEKTFPVLGTDDKIPKEIAKIAWSQYNKEQPLQSYEKIAERGGFAYSELIIHLYQMILEQGKELNNKHLTKDQAIEFAKKYLESKHENFSLDEIGIINEITEYILLDIIPYLYGESLD